jgi:hypothetical protein
MSKYSQKMLTKREYVINDQKSKNVVKNVHITDNFHCQGCKKSQKGELMKNNLYNLNESAEFIDEDEENLFENDFHINPDMEEESRCLRCFSLGLNTIASCLVDGKKLLIIRPAQLQRLFIKIRNSKKKC